MKNASLAIAAGVFGVLLILSFDFLFSKYLIRDPEMPLPLASKPYEDGDSGWYELKKNFAGSDNWGSNVFAVATDSNGFRVPAASFPETRADVIFLGDSFTYGINGAWEETFVGMYSARSGRSIMNAGVPSYSPTPYLYQYRKALASGRLKEPHAVILALDIGDVQDEANRWKDGALHPVAINELPRPVPERSLRKYVAERMLLTKTVYRYLRYGGVDGRPDEWIFDLDRSALTWRKPEQLEADYAPLGVQKGLEKTGAVLRQIGALANARGGSYYLLIYPWPAQLKYRTTALDWEQFAADACAQSGCKGVINTLPRFRELAAKNPDWYREYYVAGDTHFNALGNRVVFEEIMRQLHAR